ncbi:hypothetical protein OJ996_05685 [Luteolibacter sp. GHJ8]|uniref:Uncharacterized protein n=1 Tax=Luteolibacter rhizosphaerae TaxID=2989719 RepID=A0ABT3G054_9BACT|nr:DUF6766 family protein [Luteolibacter rhizosphaerae]MCW1913052.1 hypothetical protein [Luteolibacter rhizosphaerae]
MKRLFKNNGLSIVLLFLFVVFWIAQSVAGFHVYNNEQELHGGPLLSYNKYLSSGHFWQATGENWESEFLQMGFYVILTTFLFQRGSAESNDPDEAEELAAKRRRRRGSWLYRNSLSLAFLGLFMLAFIVHALGGLRESNQERSEHGQPAESMGEFLSGSEFWFQSFQNWQSEFLAVLSIVVLSIFLRQEGSPESKDVEEPNSKTGS